jgi:hypothetical protein
MSSYVKLLSTGAPSTARIRGSIPTANRVRPYNSQLQVTSMSIVRPDPNYLRKANARWTHVNRAVILPVLLVGIERDTKDSEGTSCSRSLGTNLCLG